MNEFELYHYGVKGMRWKNTKSHSAKSSDMKRANKKQDARIADYISKHTLVGEPNYVADENRRPVTRDEYIASKKDPLYGLKNYAKTKVSSLSGGAVKTGEHVLDSFFASPETVLKKTKHKR